MLRRAWLCLKVEGESPRAGLSTKGDNYTALQDEEKIYFAWLGEVRSAYEVRSGERPGGEETLGGWPARKFRGQKDLLQEWNGLL